ncbi:MAG: hypothetical protein BalsKO_29790 [Balneolaceae bacterium]
MAKRIIIFVVFLIALIPLYNWYCDYFWDNYYEQYQWWGREELIDTYNFSLLSPAADITSKNFTAFKWHRILVEPEHGMWINDVTLSFPSDSILLAEIQAPYIENNWWTYPLTGKFSSDTETFVGYYYFDKDEMFFVRGSFEKQHIDSLGPIRNALSDSLFRNQETVRIELHGDKLSVKYVFL